MTGSRGDRGAARRRGLVVAGVAAALLSVGAVQPAPSGVALAAPSPSPSPSAAPAAPVTIQVDELVPRAPQPGDELHVSGTITNTGTEPLQALQLRLRVGGRLATRSELALTDTQPPSYRDVRATRPLPDLQVGASTPLDLLVPVDDLRLGTIGVYPVQLEVRGVRGSVGARDTLGAVATYLPWFAGTPVDPLRLAWVWPVADAPHLAPRGAMVDDTLAGSLAPQGRLARSLAAARAGQTSRCRDAGAPTPQAAGPALADPAATTGPAPATAVPAGAVPPGAAPAGAPAPGVLPPSCTPVPVTLAVDPALLDDAKTMTSAYEVLTPTGTRPGTGTEAATAWVRQLQAAASDGDVLALPFADPDVVALTRGSSGLAADVALARTTGAAITRDVLGRDPLQSVAFPPPGRLSDAALDAVSTPTTRAVVLDPAAVSAPPDSLHSTPGTRVGLPTRTAADGVTGLVLDPALSALLTPGATQQPRLAEQRWLVETALVAAELPNRGRTLVVAPPRRAALDLAVAGAALADSARVPWVCPVRLADVAAAAEACPGAAAPSYAPDRAVQLPQPEPGAPALGAALVRQVATLRADALQLTGAVVQGGTDEAQQLRTRTQRAWLRGESSAWRESPARGLRFAALAAADVADLRAKVYVLTGRILLTSNNGRVSVSVVNELDQPVTVALRLRAPSDARLSRVQTEVLEIPARRSVPVQVDATTSTSGRFVVRAQLLDREGVPFGAPKDLLVRSTRYGVVAVAVTGIAAGVLLVAVGVRLVRRAWRRRAVPT